MLLKQKMNQKHFSLSLESVLETFVKEAKSEQRVFLVQFVLILDQQQQEEHGNAKGI